MKDKMEAIQRKHSKYSEGLGRQNGDKLVNMEIKIDKKVYKGNVDVEKKLRGFNVHIILRRRENRLNLLRAIIQIEVVVHRCGLNMQEYK